MATTYYETSTDSDLNKNTVSAPVNSKKLLQTAPGSATSLTITLASSAAGVVHWFITEPADPDTTGGSGSRDYTITVNVTTANANLAGGAAVGVQIARLNSAGTVQTSANFGAGSTWPQTSGLKTFSLTARDLGTFASTERFGFGLFLDNGAMSVQSVIVEVGLASGNEQVVAPWTFASTPTMPPIFNPIPFM